MNQFLMLLFVLEYAMLIWSVYCELLHLIYLFLVFFFVDSINE